MSDPPPIGDDVLAYYAASVESDRLASGVGALEFARAKELVARFLTESSDVADVGGGFGHYAKWLAADSHRVELVDPVPLHVEAARERAGDPARFGVQLGDARALPFADGSFDAVLLLGPLYHLGEAGDRAQALREAARICRGGGVIFAAAISRYAPLLDTTRRGRFGEEQIVANVLSETGSGRRVPAERRTSSFPDAYFHLPDELAGELAAAGLEVEGVYGVEGPGWLHPDLVAVWQDDAARERLLAAARAVERDPHLLAVSPHLLAVAAKPAAA
jgi:SAM-dependent methyltransferase